MKEFYKKRKNVHRRINCKAFTLIELLAVIIILAIIALITTPIIIISLKGAKMSAANSSALLYIGGINKSLESRSMERQSVKYDLYTLDDINANNILSDDIKVTGKKPTDAIIFISENRVRNANICIDGYNVIYNGISSEVVGECDTLYKEKELNKAYPIYSSNMIPVIIDNGDEDSQNAGKVYKADITDADNPWYSYDSKKWANAVILKEDKTGKYKEKPFGTEIDSSDIESYFVWIPRYAYKLFFDSLNYNSITENKPATDGELAKLIEIEFGAKTTSGDKAGECTTPMVSGENGQCVNGDYMTHPAFISMNSNGIWIGKFETTGNEDNLSVLPNVSSLRSKTAKQMFELAYNYKRENDSHMMKNTEWGAVAYLSHSKYGIESEVRINNNAECKTGYAATTKPECYGQQCPTHELTENMPYNNPDYGYKASTNGNISGIYDMSGGANERMAAYSESEQIYTEFSKSSISKYADKYFDKYLSSASEKKKNTNEAQKSAEKEYNRMILGDATGEMGPFYYYNDMNNDPNEEQSRPHNNWYQDFSRFISNQKSWFLRGGFRYSESLGGQFYFIDTDGSSHGDVGFRLVLVQ